VLSALRDVTSAAGLTGPAGRVWEQPPPASRPDGPPSSATLAGEALAGIQVPRLLLGAPRLALAPRGDGGPVIDIPGWRAPESSMAPLRAYLRRLGHDARTWGFGTNLGNPQRDAERMSRRVADLSLENGRRVGLVGWSLGGVIAREVAREVPEHVACVITYGTPIIGGPMHTVAAGSYEPGFGDHVDEILDELNASRPIRVPILSIFSRRDGIVSWQACIDRASPQVRHVEVGSTHIGLGIDPDVWLLVARELALRLPDGAEPEIQ
jgi:pimeloyl-ACP methyl ester carboxylesterase